MGLFDVRTVTATTDAETIGDNKVICQSIEIAQAFSSKNNGSMIQSITILDETTTTPDLIDRNILYAKIFVKPARAIEFIALDFIITRSGASFDD